MIIQYIPTEICQNGNNGKISYGGRNQLIFCLGVYNGKISLNDILIKFWQEGKWNQDEDMRPVNDRSFAN